MIEPGQKIPDVVLKTKVDGTVHKVTTDDLFAGQKVVLFGVPGAFTPTCSERHLPGFIAQADAIRAKGVDRIVCVAVNDHHVMAAWADASGADGKVELVADGNGALARALGVELDLTAAGMGLRCKRFAAIVEDGFIKSIEVDPTGVDKSGAEAILARL